MAQRRARGWRTEVHEHVPRSPGGKQETAGYGGALQSYLRAIRRFKLLTQSGEFRLATASRQGEEKAQNAMVEANLRLVVKIAMEYRHTHVGLDDLIAEGNLGLIEAAKRFDPQRGVRFVSYAAWWIRKFMLQAVQRQAHQTSTPARPSDRPASSGTDPRSGSPGRPPTRLRILSYDDFVQNSSDRHVLEKFALGETAEPEDLILEKQLEEALAAVLPRLPEQERTILSAHYGLDGQAPRTLQEIGLSLGVTRERIRKIELRAIERARRLLQGGRPG